MRDRHAQRAADEHPRNVVERRIDATDAQIDRLVYALYGLKEDEIALVEQSARE